MRSEIKPSGEKLKILLERALRKNHLISITCNCEVEYRGRAVSKLGTGDRLLIIKPDKTAIIHQPEGRNPVNWMPAKSSISLEEETLIIESINPRETMQVRILEAHMFSSSPLNDDKSIVQAGSEADMASMIYKNPRIIGEFVPASMEEQTAYGFVDVFGKDFENNLVVVECKRYKAGLDAVQQLRRYVERVKHEKGKKIVKGIIAAPGITENAKKMLEDWNFSFVMVEPPMYLLPDKEKQRLLHEF